MKKTGPYIGITGFMSLPEVVVCNNAFREAVSNTNEKGGTLPADLKFMVGVLVNIKTLLGETNRRPNRYPPIARVPEIFSLKDRHLLRTIHYNTDDIERVEQIMAIAPADIDALQLNIRWANPVKLQKVRRKYPNLRIILQVGAGALADVSEPEDIYLGLGKALRAYEGVADDFLVDSSGGEGKELDVWKTFACLADSEIPRGMMPGAAGGRDADNLSGFQGLVRRLGRPINFDAERRLRTDEDHLDLAKASRYLSSAVNAFSSFLF
ncbi:MAG: hypothetical protein Q7R58_01290 [bacterium]|nr:hypothetical protein [bacterium]